MLPRTRVTTAGLLYHAPAAGFEQPFEMLEACDERVRRSCDLLARLIATRSRGAAARIDA